jgi:hypothetical protein
MATSPSAYRASDSAVAPSRRTLGGPSAARCSCARGEEDLRTAACRFQDEAGPLAGAIAPAAAVEEDLGPFTSPETEARGVDGVRDQDRAVAASGPFEHLGAGLGRGDEAVDQLHVGQGRVEPLGVGYEHGADAAPGMSMAPIWQRSSRKERSTPNLPCAIAS